MRVQVSEMTLTQQTQTTLNRLRELLPLTEDDVVQRGITEEVMARIAALRRAASRLARLYGTLEGLEARIESEGVSPDDHTLYTDLLEWRSARRELGELTAFLEKV